MTYTVVVTQRKAPRHSRLAAWLRGQRAPVMATTTWPPCPVCGADVREWQPRIREGDEFRSGIVSWKHSDELVGFTLRPCGCEVPHVAMVSA